MGDIMTKKFFLAIIVSLFCVMGMAFQVKAEQMYILDNIVLNSDFSLDTNTNGLADNFIIATAGTNPYISNNSQYWTPASAGWSSHYLFTYGYTISIVANHEYYVFISNSQNISYFGFGFNNTDVDLRTNKSYSGIVITPDNETDVYACPQYANQLAFIGYFMVIDLTATFGSGYEPSLSDFETLYLPDLDYFDEYTSFDPDNYIDLVMTDYVNMGTDLTGLDYSKSVVDVYGDNMDVDISMYVYATSPASHSYDVDYYITNNHPEICYLGSCESLSWVVSDYSEFVIDLVMTDAQTDVLKRILFNRSIDVDNEYFNFDVMASAASYSKVWIAISSAFDLRVDVNSILVSRDIYTENAFNMDQTMIFKAYDKYNNIILPAVRLTVGDVFETRLVNDFGSQYTDISRFNLEFELTSPDYDDTYTMERTYLYELGIFSHDDIIQPNYYDDSEIGSIFNQQTCEWYELGCQATNAVNSMMASIWNFLDIDAIIDTFDGIIDSATTFVNVLPSAWVAIVIVVISGASVGIILIVIDRL